MDEWVKNSLDKSFLENLNKSNINRDLPSVAQDFFWSCGALLHKESLYKHLLRLIFKPRGERLRK